MFVFFKTFSLSFEVLYFHLIHFPPDQELLIYLSMFICTEPNLFTEMLRLRVGLIVQVMTSELARAMECEGNNQMNII